ncbi:Hypothetical protein AJAP_28150 [Amycolatopsis japonica]|uniref:Tape measure protein n=1 Tax=Amycolatopsis japonica TaxID=208439 RepID=A0A075UZR2_9PSEU|nr:hypothetical protein [Amycolatopsis japonica]AIG78468.1 Hypothetical protein AJAP_28150 [Amycolatopsis japonica]
MAKGPGTKNTVGKVGVKVTPDTSKFAEELKAKLEQIEKNARVEIPVDLDTKEAAAQFQALKARLEAQEINAKVNVDQSGIRRLSSSLRAIGQDGNLFTRLGQSLSSAGASAERMAQAIVTMRREMAAMAAQTAIWAGQVVRSVVSINNAKTAWTGLQLAALRVGDTLSKIPSLAGLARDLALTGRIAGMLAVDKVQAFGKSIASAKTYTEGFKTAMTGVGVYAIKASDAVSNLGKRIKSITWNDVTNGLRNATRSVAMFGRSVNKNMGKSVDRTILGVGRGIRSAFDGASSIFKQMGDAVGSAAGKLGELGRTGWILVGVVVLLAPLIGLIAGLLAGLPSLVFAFGGAIAAVALGFEGIKKAASSLGPQVDKLKASLSDTFAKGLTPVFQQLGQIFPVLQTGLNQVAQGLIPMAKAFTDVVTSAAGMQQISNILANTGKFFTALAPMVTQFMQAFLTLADVGSQSFGVLSGVLVDFATQFNQIVNNLNASGALTSALQGLGKVTGSLLSMFGRLFEAGVVAMGQLGGPLSTFVDGFANALVALMPALTSISGLLFNVLGKALSAIAPVIEKLTPAFTMLADTLGSLLVGAIDGLAPILTALAEILGTVILTALQALQPVIPPLVQFLGQLGKVIGDALLQAFQALSPLLPIIAKAITDILMAVTPLLPAIIQLVQAGLQAFLAIVIPLIPLLIQLVQTVLPIFVELFQSAVPVLVQVAQAIAQILPPIAEIVGTIITALMPVFEGVLALVQKVWPGIRDIIQGAMKIISGIIKSVMAALKGDWTGAWNGIKDVVSGAWQMIKGAVSAAINTVIHYVRDMPGRILSALGNLGDLLWKAGKAIIDGLLRGLKAAWGAVTDFVGGIASWIKNNKGPISYDRRLLVPAGKAIMNGLHEGLSRDFEKVRSLVTGMGDRIAYAFDGSSVGSAWAQSVRDGTPEAISSVEDLMSAVNKTASVEWQGAVSADGFGSIGDRVAAALAGWSVDIDGDGIARLVNKSNNRKKRRG